MSLNFSAFEGKNIFKFAKYEVKEIGKTKYIVPDSINKKHSSGAPLIDIEKDFEESILIDLLNIGKLAFYNENDIEKSVLDFVNKYSTLGLINDLPLNKYFFLDDKIVLKDYNYIGNSDLTTVVDRKKYFKLFFPTCDDSQIKELINEVTKLTETPAMEKYRIMRNAPAEIVPQYGEELCKAGFTVELDRDNCDYLYSRNDLALLKGKAFHKKKNLVNQFLKLYDKDVRELDDLTTKDAFSVLDKWKRHRLEEGGDDGDFEQCTLALKNRVFFDLKGIVVYAGGIPSGFCLGEFSSDEKMFICHFE